MPGARGRIVNFSTVAVPYNLEGEAAYAASQAAVVFFCMYAPCWSSKSALRS